MFRQAIGSMPVPSAALCPVNGSGKTDTQGIVTIRVTNLYNRHKRIHSIVRQPQRPVSEALCFLSEEKSVCLFLSFCTLEPLANGSLEN